MTFDKSNPPHGGMGSLGHIQEQFADITGARALAAQLDSCRTAAQIANEAFKATG